MRRPLLPILLCLVGCAGGEAVPCAAVGHAVATADRCTLTATECDDDATVSVACERVGVSFRCDWVVALGDGTGDDGSFRTSKEVCGVADGPRLADVFTRETGWSIVAPEASTDESDVEPSADL